MHREEGRLRAKPQQGEEKRQNSSQHEPIVGVAAMALRPALRGGLGGTSRGIIWPASFAIACTIICLGVSHSTSGPVSLSERQGPGGWHGGGASCGTLCQAKKLIMSTKKAINAQADDMIDKLQGKGDDSISKSRISSGESASHWHHNGHGRGGGAGGGSVAAHGSGGIPADARHPLAVNRLHRLWSDVHDIRKARPLFDAHKQLQERLHHHHHHHQNARGEKDKEEKEQEEWLHSGAHIAQTPEEMKEFGRDARGENQHPDEHIDKATHVSEPPTSKMSSSIRRPAPSSAQRPATPADLANFVREVEKPGGIDTAVARIANGRANTDQQQLGTSGRACVDNPRWRSPIGDDCGKYGYGGDRSFWCSWDGASRLDACPASCGTCTRGMLKSSVEAEKAVERELSEHYDPQTLVKTKGGGASDGPSEPRKVQARREAKSRLEGEVSSLKKKLAEMAEALSRDPTSAGVIPTHSHHLDLVLGGGILEM
jgi:hypothetical protein